MEAIMKVSQIEQYSTRVSVEISEENYRLLYRGKHKIVITPLLRGKDRIVSFNAVIVPHTE